MNLNGLMQRSRQSFSEFWGARDARERVVLAVAAVIAMFGLIFVSLLYPALTGRDQLNKDLPALRQQVALLQALSKEAAAFSGKAALPVAPITRENIDAALARKGLKPQSVTLSDDLVKVQLAAASFSGTLSWLDDMQKTALLSVVDANIVALAKPDTINATLTLRQQRND